MHLRAGAAGGPRLVMLGRQGSGKGTQSTLLSSRLGVPAISTGELFRQEVAAGTPLGRRVQSYLDSGQLVPDEVTLDVVSRHLAAGKGWVLDGFPRTVGQASAVVEAVDLVIELHVPFDVALRRLATRRVCRGCGATSTAAAGDPPEAACGRCGGVVARRDDDTEDAIRHRLALYERETGPLLFWLHSRDLLRVVDAVGTVDAIHWRVLDALGERRPEVVERALSRRASDGA
jgi:adenylate kinase